MQTKERILFWDILKGYGIISIVIGHCYWVLQPYVYTYHLALFFFVSAYFYNEKKYLDKPFDYVGNLFKNNWTKYVFYMVLLVLFHNFNVRFGLYYDMQYYSLSSAIYNMLVSFVFACGELFGGAMWFVLPNMFSCALLAVGVSLSNKAARFITKKPSAEYIKWAVLILLAIFFNVTFSTQNVLIYNVHLAFLIAPITVTAYFIRKFAGMDLRKYLNVFVSLVFACFIFVLVKYAGFRVELTQGVIPGKIWFYVLSLMGIYLCMYLSKITEKIPYFNKFMAFLGKYSFSIMALHFFAIKLVDRTYAFVTGEKDPAIFGRWVSAYQDKLWWVYLIVATIMPAVFGWLVNKIKIWAQNRIAKNS